MTRRRPGILVPTILAAWALGWSEEPERASVETRARGLEENATHLVSLFHRGQAPFRLRASILTHDARGAKSGEGPYALDWVAPARWREEIRIGDLFWARGVTDDRSWLTNPAAVHSIRIRQVRELLGPRLLEAPGAEEEPKKIRERSVDGATCLCVRFERGGAEREACYEAARGVLLREERRPESRNTTVRTDSAHAAFRDALYPRVRTLRESGLPAVEAREIELRDLADAQPERFDPPDGATVSPWCEGMTAPERVHRVMPAFPESARAARIRGHVTVEAHVREDGSVGDVRVIRSLTPDTDASAVGAIRQWRYRPALCGERSVPVDLLIDTAYWIE